MIYSSGVKLEAPIRPIRFHNSKENINCFFFRISSERHAQHGGNIYVATIRLLMHCVAYLQQFFSALTRRCAIFNLFKMNTHVHRQQSAINFNNGKSLSILYGQMMWLNCDYRRSSMIKLPSPGIKKYGMAVLIFPQFTNSRICKRITILLLRCTIVLPVFSHPERFQKVWLSLLHAAS